MLGPGMWLAACLGLLGPVPAAAPPRVLVYTVSAGFEHAVVKRSAPEAWSLVEQKLVDWGRESGAYEAVVTRDPALFEPASLARFAAVVFYTTGELPLGATGCESLFTFVRGGGGFVGLHSATDTLHGVADYGALLGARFDGHPWHEPVRIVVEDRAHVAVAHLELGFEITDEIYQFRSPYAREDVHVLLSLDLASVDVRREGVRRTDGDFALAWTRPFGAGRVFYTALGHGENVWADPRYRDHVIGGVRYATRTAPARAWNEKDVARRTRALAGDGDVAKGRALFERADGPRCLSCHVVGSSGGRVGPDLSSVARRLTREELVEAVLAPSASIVHRYSATVFERTDGTRVLGRLVAETDGGLSFVDGRGQSHEWKRAELNSRAPGAASLMPADLVADLDPEAFSDLIAYVSTLQGAPR